MIENIVRYLHSARVPFRLSSYPSQEAEPKAAHPLPPHAALVASQILTVDGRAVLVGFPAGERVDLDAVGSTLGGVALEGSTADLPDELRYARGWVPPFGQLYGLPVVLDERLTRAAVLAFQPFGESDYLEIPYEDYARLEQPRIASFASFGELGPARGARPRPGA